MKKLLVCQHVSHEILGTLDPMFRESGFRIRYANFSRFPTIEPSIKSYDGLVILGGPMNVADVDKYPHLAYEISLIQEALKKDIPILGICLGAQLIAKSLGAAVYPNREKEIGWYDVSRTPEGSSDPLFKNYSDTEKLFQWHGQTFDIPPKAVHLASSVLCQNQAFRFGNKVYGIQFHLEVDEPMIERWLKVPDNADELAHLREKMTPAQIRHDTQKHLKRLHSLSEMVFGEFVKLFGEKKKYHVLSSR
jgi:GMP synthase (glutamine-hydrolysing)